MLRRTTQTTRVSANPVKVFPPNHFNLHLYSCHHCVSIFLTGCQASPSAVRLFFFFFLSPFLSLPPLSFCHQLAASLCVCACTWYV